MFKARILDVISYILPTGSFSQWLDTFQSLDEGMKMMVAEQIPEMDLEINELVLRLIPGSHFTISNKNVFFMIHLPDQDPEKQHQLDYTEKLLTELTRLNPKGGLEEFSKKVFNYDHLPVELTLRVIQDVYELTHGSVYSNNTRHVKSEGIWIPYILSVKETEKGKVTFEFQAGLAETPTHDHDWVYLDTKSKFFPIGICSELEIVQLESVLEEG